MNFSKKNHELLRINKSNVSKKLTNSIIVLVLFTIILTSCNSTAKTTQAAIPAKETKLENSLLWKISDNGLEKASYLYGTIHMTCNFVLTDKMKNAFAETNQLALEVDMDDPTMQSKMMQGMMMTDGKTIKNILSAEDFSKLSSFFKDNTEMNLEMFNTVKPFVVSAMLISKMVPCSPPVSYEIEFMKIAKEQNEEVQGLETIEYQMSVFDSIPYNDQLDELVKMATEGIEESKSEFTRITELHAKEDIEGLLKIMTESEDMTAMFKDELLDKRNQNWIPVIQELSKEMPTFFGVGAMHLPGDQGVIKLLRKKGYTVEPVK